MASDSRLAAEKAALRSELKRTLRLLPAARRQKAAQAAATTAAALDSYRCASLILAFLSMSSEIDTAPLLEAAVRDGRRVAVPRIDGDDIVFIELDEAWRGWPRDRWDIPMPPPHAVPLSPAAIAALPTLALVPGLGFDDGGGRLGRGKGYYDRFLAAVEAERQRRGDAAQPFLALGYGFIEQRLDRVPTGPADRPLDGLILA